MPQATGGGVVQSSSQIVDGIILDADIAANAAIARTKFANISATARVLGRKTAGAGAEEEMTLSELLDFIGSATKGDILVRDTSAWARLAAGAAATVLTGNGAGALPSFQAVASPTYKNGQTTRDLTTASGVQNIAHGMGKVPNKVRISFLGPLLNFTSAKGAVQGITVYNGTTQSSISLNGDQGQTPNWLLSAGTTIVLQTDTSNTQTGTVTFDATNIIITWVKAGSPTGTTNIVWEAE